MSKVAGGRPKKKVANSLVAMSSAAVMAVYAAGYQRTRSAAERFNAQALERRVKPLPPPVVTPVTTPASATAVEPVRRAEPPIAAVARQKLEPEPATVAVEPAPPPERIDAVPEPPPAAVLPAPELISASPAVLPPPPPPP